MTHAAPLVLALDIGSSSVRAMLIDATSGHDASPVSQISYSLQTTADGGAELDAPALLDAVGTCLDALFEQQPTPADSIVLVACATLAGNLLGVDEHNQACTPIWTWADTRARNVTQALRAAWDAAAIWERTGCPIHSAYLPARLIWLQQTNPALFQSVARWQTIGEYLTGQWTGQPLLSMSIAAWNGLLNRHTGTWDHELVARLPITPEQLGQPLPPTAQGATLRPKLAQRWPALRAARWLAPVGDGVGSNIGCGGIDAQTVVINLGTSGALRVLLPSGGPIPYGLWRYRVSSMQDLVGGALSNAGNLIRWALDTLRLPPIDTAEEQLMQRQVGAHGLAVVPHLAGERSPHYADDARGIIAGLHLQTSGLDMLQALMEAVAVSLAQLYSALRPLLPAEHRIVGSGGALRNSPVWQQMICDALGAPLELIDIREATIHGVAWQALTALGQRPSLAHTQPLTKQTRTPNPAHSRYYQALQSELEQLQARVGATAKLA